MNAPLPSRRALLQGAGAGVGLMCLGACGHTPQLPANKGPGVIKVADVPVGGGAIIADSYYVVTQPTRGVFHAFSRMCPHAGFMVDDVADGVIICPGHGSRFAIGDGHKVSGPAARGLSPVTCTVQGDTITVTG